MNPNPKTTQKRSGNDKVGVLSSTAGLSMSFDFSMARLTDSGFSLSSHVRPPPNTSDPQRDGEPIHGNEPTLLRRNELLGTPHKSHASQAVHTIQEEARRWSVPHRLLCCSQVARTSLEILQSSRDLAVKMRADTQIRTV